MKITPFALTLGLAFAPSAFAQVVTYSDVIMNLPGSSGQTITQTALLSLSPDHRFIDPDSGSPTMVRYYGGTLTYTGGSEWGGSGQLFLTNEADPDNTNVHLGMGAGSTQWRFMTNNTGVSTASIDFVIKITDEAYNVASLQVFVGAGATSATEGTPVLTVNSGNSSGVVNLSLTSLSFRLFGESWEVAPQSLTATNLFSSTEWSPVGATTVPEPSAFALVGGAAALALVLSRRPRRAA